MSQMFPWLQLKVEHNFRVKVSGYFILYDPKSLDMQFSLLKQHEALHQWILNFFQTLKKPVIIFTK